MRSKVVRTNLSVAPLAGGATFTGTGWRAGSNLSRIALHVFTDQTGNVHIDGSRDGATWRAGPANAIAANTSLIVEQRLILPYVRVRLINGATPQTLLDLNVAFFEV